MLKTVREKSELLDSCISIIESSINNPELKANCLFKLDVYKQKENDVSNKTEISDIVQKAKEVLDNNLNKKIYILEIDKDDMKNFIKNYEEVAKDFDLNAEHKYISDDGFDIKYKLILSGNIHNENKFWNALDKYLEDRFKYELVS